MKFPNETFSFQILKGICSRRRLVRPPVKCAVIWILLLIIVYLCLNFELAFESELPSEFKKHLCDNLTKSKSKQHRVLKFVARQRTTQKLHFEHDRDCDKFRRILGFRVRISTDEANFPLAYSINVYEDAIQVARFLRLIYRPHNLYCIHVDAKAPEEFWTSMIQLAKCFTPNVLLVDYSKRVDVQWGHYSLLESAQICANYLIQNKEVHWRYMLNVNGKEMPLKTNWELVTAIRALNGSNMVEAVNASGFSQRIPKKAFKFNFTWVKGSFLTVLRRDFVNFMLTDSKALEILDAFKQEQHLVKVPDEFYFSTLAYNPQLGAPGSCMELKYSAPNDERTYFLSRYVKWYEDQCPQGLRRHDICIFGIDDLPDLVARPELFANKFFENYEPLGYDCMELWLMNKIVREWQTNKLDPLFNVTPYSELYCSRNHFEPEM